MKYRVNFFEELVSTNDTANDVLYGNGDIIVAGFQSGGRGQRGASWRSSRNENLLCSLVLEDLGVKVCEQFVVCEISSLAVCGALNELLKNSGRKAMVKWPNDVVIKSGVGQKNCKIAGILIENNLSGEFLGKVIVGMGINVGQREFEENLAWPATSLALLGLEIEVNEVLDRVCKQFSRLLELDREKVHSEYLENLWRKESFYPFLDTKTNEEFRAKIIEVDKNVGTITLQKQNNEQHKYLFKEVRYL